MEATAHELIARLRKHPDDAHAYAALKACYHDEGDHASLANLVEGWARRVADPGQSAAAYHEAARIVSYYLDDQPRASELLSAGLERDPRLPELAEDLDRVLEALGDSRGRLRALERRAALLGDIGAEAAEIGAVHFRLGELYEHVVARPDRAIAAYRTAFELDPEHIPAIYAAREIYRRSGNLRSAAELFDAEIRAEPDRDRKVALLREVAHLRGQGLSDLDGAVSALEQALSYSPSDLEVLHELATLHHRRAMSVEDFDAATRELRRSADLMVRIAQMSPPAEAVPFCEAALDLSPSHDEALSLYEFLAHETGCEERLPPRWVGFLAHAPSAPSSTRRRVLLADAYASFGQLDDAIACLEPLLATGDAEAASRLASLYRQVGRLDAAAQADGLAMVAMPEPARIERHRDLLHSAIESGDDDGIATHGHELLRREAADAATIDALVDLERRRDRKDSLRQLLLRVGHDDARSPTDRLQALREAAELADQVGNAEGALDANAAIYRLDPGNAEARSAVERGLAAAGRDDELARLLEWEASALPSFADRRRAVLALHELGRRIGAIPESLRALAGALTEEAPGDMELLDLQVALERGSGNPSALLELLARRVESSTKKSERIALLREIAALAEESLGDDERAYSALSDALELDPTSAETFAEAERLATKHGRTDRRVELLEHRAAIARGAERADVLLRLAEIVEREGTVDDAIARYEAALAERPDHAPTFEALRRLLDTDERRDRLVALLRGRADRTNDPELRIAALHDLASVADPVASLRPIAKAALREIRSIREDDRALATLLDYAREEGPATELAELLRARIARVTTTGEVRDLRLELADVAFGELGDDDTGIAELEGVRQLDPSFLPALERLAHAYEARGDAARLATVLATQLDGAVDPVTRRDLAMRLHAIHTSTVPDADRAIAALHAWARAVPEDIAPIEALLPLLESRGQHRQLVEALDRLAAVEGRDDRAALSARAARICSGPLADAEAALERFARAVLLGDASSEDALRELGRSTHLEKNLARHLEALARAADTPSDAQRRLLEASDLYAGVNDSRAALEAAILAYELGYGAEHVLARVRSIARDARLHARLLSFLEQLSSASASSLDESVRGYLECAELASKELRDLERARTFVERALDVAGADGELVARVEATARALDRTVATGGAILERALVTRLVTKSREASGEERDALLLRAAGILADALDDVPAAYELLHAASVDEIRTSLFRKLVVLAVHGGRATELDRELDGRIDEALETDVVRSLLRARAELLGAMGRHHEAADQLQRLSAMSPDDEDARVAHRDALRRAGRHEDLVRALDQAARRAPSTEGKIALLAELADVWEGPLHNRFEALDVWRRVAKLSPDAAEAAIARLSPRTRVGTDSLEESAAIDSLIPPVVTGSARRSVAPPPSLRPRSLPAPAPAPRVAPPPPKAPPTPSRLAAPPVASDLEPLPGESRLERADVAHPNAPAAPRSPANDVRVDALESLTALDARPVTDPAIPELLDDLPEDPEAEGLDPIRLDALRMRGIDPSLLDEPIVDDFDAGDAVLDASDAVLDASDAVLDVEDSVLEAAEAVLDDEVEEIEDIDEHEAVLEDDFEDVSGEMLVDPSLVSLEDDVNDDEPIRSVRPLPTPPPPPRKR